MNPDVDNFIGGRIERFSRILAAAVVLIGGLILMGWALDLELLKGGFPGLQAVKANAALAFILCGASLWFYNSRQSVHLAQGLAMGAILLGLLTLGEHVLGWNLGLDQILISDNSMPASSHPGRMALLASLNFLVVGISLFFLRSRPRMSQMLALLGGVLGLLGITGFLYYESRHTYGFLSYTQMPFLSSLTFLILCAGILFFYPEREFMARFISRGPGGIIMRRLLLPLGIFLFVLEWAEMTAENAGHFEANFIHSLGIIATVSVLAGVLWWNARNLDTIDEKRKRAEEVLRESEERSRHISELIPDFAYSCRKSPDGLFAIDWMTGGFEKITGYTTDEIYEMSCWRPLVVEDDIPIFDKNVVGLSPGESIRSEIRIRKKDGEIVWLASFVECITDPQNSSYLRIYGGCRDITERKRAEEALVKKSRDLARSNADLAQFAYVASHDLQEPLRMVTSYVQLLEKRYKGKLDPDADEFIGYIVEGTKRMKQLLTALLDYSRVGSRGKLFQPIDGEAILEAALKNLKVILEETKGVVTHDPLPRIVVDETQMVQLFQNLIGNALKFHGPEPPQVHVSSRREGEVWIFAVRDNGIGIDPQYHQKIFVIFQRLHGRDEYPGTGIGLAIAQLIVERHGGRIWVESEKGEGSAFYFTIPVDGVNGGRDI